MPKKQNLKKATKTEDVEIDENQERKLLSELKGAKVRCTLRA